MLLLNVTTHVWCRKQAINDLWAPLFIYMDSKRATTKCIATALVCQPCWISCWLFCNHHSALLNVGDVGGRMRSLTHRTIILRPRRISRLVSSTWYKVTAMVRSSYLHQLLSVQNNQTSTTIRSYRNFCLHVSCSGSLVSCSVLSPSSLPVRSLSAASLSHQHASKISYTQFHRRFVHY